MTQEITELTLNGVVKTSNYLLQIVSFVDVFSNFRRIALPQQTRFVDLARFTKRVEQVGKTVADYEKKPIRVRVYIRSGAVDHSKTG